MTNRKTFDSSAEIDIDTPSTRPIESAVVRVTDAIVSEHNKQLNTQLAKFDISRVQSLYREWEKMMNFEDALEVLKKIPEIVIVEDRIDVLKPILRILKSYFGEHNLQLIHDLPGFQDKLKQLNGETLILSDNHLHDLSAADWLRANKQFLQKPDLYVQSFSGQNNEPFEDLVREGLVGWREFPKNGKSINPANIIDITCSYLAAKEYRLKFTSPSEPR